jgi:hypothetical protein
MTTHLIIYDLFLVFLWHFHTKKHDYSYVSFHVGNGSFNAWILQVKIQVNSLRIQDSVLSTQFGTISHSEC